MDESSGFSRLSNWMAAARAVIEPQLACACGAMNSPTLLVIHIDERGTVACDQCGKGGQISEFLRYPPMVV